MTDLIPTRASMLNKKSQEDFQTVVHCSYKKKVRENKPASANNNIKNGKNKESINEIFNIKKAKHEVFKLGVSGFDSQKKHQAKIELAIKLGAKPPRNKYKNYKEVLEEKRKEKETTKSIQDFQQLGKNQFGKSTAKGKGFDRKRRKQKGDLLEEYGTVKRLKIKPRK